MDQFAILTVLAAFYAPTLAQNPDDLFVETVYGDVEGHFITLGDGQVVRSFLGIPYAAPPVGDLRFRAPEEPAPWLDVLEADRLGDACPQHNTLLPATHPNWDRFDEDCLTLNIYTPYNHAEPGPYPVLVFIHGGAYATGASIRYHGHFYASRGVVTVAFNYRLAQLGFLYTGDDVARGNFGLLDQMLALRFVQQNIANFGGDPSRVTISGYSSGSASVGQLILSPLATGLFQQGIMMSGTDMSPWSINRPDIMVNFTRQVAQNTDCLSENTLEMVDCLRLLSTQDLLNATWRQYPTQESIGFIPVPDALGGVLPDYPSALRESGQFNKVPVMVGRTNKETSAAYSFVPDGEGFNSTIFHEQIRVILEDRFLVYGPVTVQDILKAAEFQYTPWPHVENTTGNRDNAVQLRDDFFYGSGIDVVLRSHAAHNTTTYQYVFGYRSPTLDADYPRWMGAFHWTDLEYMVGRPLLSENPQVAQDHEMEPGNWAQMDKDYSNYWMNLITNYVKFGNPTPSPVPAPGGKNATTWPPFRLDAMNYLEIYNETITVKQNLMARNNAFFREYIPWIVDFTTSFGSMEHWLEKLSEDRPLHLDEAVLDV